ncbi:MAG: TIGR03986 family CRISPR-associated RAMP protein [Deltaproteobacteria bacterium]|nr:TIGR03986 family CRISPR-associated RAMP protein [Deltaproteobacteria bacterium]
MAVYPDSVTTDTESHFDTFKSDTLTGYLNVELTTETPSLFGAYQYSAEESVEKNNFSEVDKERNIIVPMFADACQDIKSPVLIPGSTLKGCIRSAFSALTGSPMLRAGERKFLFRPNAQVNNNTPFYCCKLIKTKDHDNPYSIRAWRVTPENIFFSNLRLNPGEFLDIANKGIKYKKAGVRRIAAKLVNRNWDEPLAPGKYLILDSHTGIDGHGTLGSEFDHPSPGYSKIVINIDADNIPLEFSQDILNNYRESLDIMSDSMKGHLADHPLTFDKTAVIQNINNIKNNCKDLETFYSAHRYTAFFVNIRTVNGREEIDSFGHHFRYLWRFRDSVHFKDTKPREELKIKKDDMAMNLFGHVQEDDKKTGKDKIEIAGRVSFNHAVEVIQPDDKPQDRFEGNSSNMPPWHVHLKILGSPKPSYFGYLKKSGTRPQIPGRTFNKPTWGDTMHPNKEPGGDLAGRKFYIHFNPMVQSKPHFHYVPADNKTEHVSQIAAYITKSGRKFRFRVRFRNLTPGELAYLITSIELKYGTCDSKYHHKIGHGRPLGMGSVKMEIKSAAFLSNKMEMSSLENPPSGGWLALPYKEYTFTPGNGEETLNDLLSPNKHLSEIINDIVLSNRGVITYPAAGRGAYDKSDFARNR